MTHTLPDDLDYGLNASRRLLEDGASDRHKAAHTPSVATLDPNGQPHQRIMVLRECDWQKRTLRFHTDTRSRKTSEIGNNPNMSVLIYDAEEKIQLRISGRGRIESDSGMADDAWAKSSNFAKRCYLAEHGPSSVSPVPTSGLPDVVQGVKPDDEQLLPARKNFALLIVEMLSIDWLFLDQNGHRRALYDWDREHGRWNGIWLVP